MTTGQIILDELIKVHTRSYFDKAPRGSIFPFVVFRLPSQFRTNFNSTKIILEIDVWSNLDNNIAALETLKDSIITAFKYKIYRDVTTTLFFHHESTLQIQTDEENTRRRKMTFTVEEFKEVTE